MFHPFVNDLGVRLVGSEAGGEGPEGLNSATLSLGKPGVLHGTRTYLLQVRLAVDQSVTVNQSASQQPVSQLTFFKKPILTSKFSQPAS